MPSVRSRVYTKLITSVDKFVPKSLRPLWIHPAGPKTVFFWAPVFKSGLIIGSLGDLNRPANTISARQSATLATTGIIWSRWCLIIKPQNYTLSGVNFVFFLLQSYQTYRAMVYG